MLLPVLPRFLRPDGRYRNHFGRAGGPSGAGPQARGASQDQPPQGSTAPRPVRRRGPLADWASHRCPVPDLAGAARRGVRPHAVRRSSPGGWRRPSSCLPCPCSLRPTLASASWRSGRTPAGAKPAPTRRSSPSSRVPGSMLGAPPYRRAHAWRLRHPPGKTLTRSDRRAAARAGCRRTGRLGVLFARSRAKKANSEVMAKIA